jgi:glycosyltransferase involved in cell wall biosynthesis
MIEAMACGTPVLAFSGGSVPEIVRDGVSGWICRDVDDMALRAQAPDIRAESCRAWAAEHFSVECMVERYISLYAHTLDERPRVASVGPRMPARRASAQ